MEERVCKSCCATKDIEEFDGFKTCNRCRAAKRKCYKKNQKEYNQARREERAKGSKLCEECGHRIKKKNMGSPFPLRFASEFRTKCAIKGLFKATGRFKKTGQTKRQNTSRLRKNTRSQKKIIRKRLNEQFPNRFVDEEGTSEQQPDHEKPKSDIDKVFSHVQQLLMNDDVLEDYFILFGKHKDRIMIEIQVDSA